MRKYNKFSFFKKLNIKDKKVLILSFALVVVLLPAMFFAGNFKSQIHKAELRFSEKSSISGVLGSVIPASCDSTLANTTSCFWLTGCTTIGPDGYNNDGNYTGCTCSNGATNYPTCTPAPVCGSSNNTSFTSAPTSGYCSVGTASGVSGSGNPSWSWSCTTWRSAATSVGCVAYAKAICGPATGRKYKESEVPNIATQETTFCQTGGAGTLMPAVNTAATWRLCTAADRAAGICIWNIVAVPAVSTPAYWTPGTVTYTRNAQGKATLASWTCKTGYPNGETSCSAPVVDPNLAVNVTKSGTHPTCVSGEMWNGTACVAPSGTITASPTSCDIAAGQSSCNSNLTWNTLDYSATSVVTDSAGVTLYTSNSNTGFRVVVANTGETFYLKNNGKILDSVRVGSSCVSGTTWNGSSCIYASGFITPSSSSCYIPVGSASCSINLDWYTDYPVGTSAITSNEGTLYTANKGTNQSVALGFTNGLSKTYYLYNAARLLHQVSLSSSCISGSSWNGSSCVLPTGTISTSNSSNCVINVDARTCTVSFSWSTNNPIGRSSVIVGSTNSEVANSNSGGYSASISKNGETYYLRNNNRNIASVSLTATCKSGSTWNGNYCKKN